MISTPTRPQCSQLLTIANCSDLRHPRRTGSMLNRMFEKASKPGGATVSPRTGTGVEASNDISADGIQRREMKLIMEPGEPMANRLKALLSVLVFTAMVTATASAQSDLAVTALGGQPIS